MKDEWATVWEHLSALRKTAIYCFVTLAIGFFIAFYFSDLIISQYTHSLYPSPLKKDRVEVYRYTNLQSNEFIYHLPANARVINHSKQVKLLYNSEYLLPSEGFIEIETTREASPLVLINPLEGMLTSLKVAFWTSLGLTCPIWGFYLLQFILPGLHPHERRLLFPFIILSVAFMCGGIAFAYFGTIPLANGYLLHFNESLGTNLWSLQHYIDYSLVLTMANAIGFELGAILLFGVHLGLFTAEGMQNKRRHVILGAFIIAAILTPPDVLTQFLLAIPLLIVYECAIGYAYFRRRKQRSLDA